MEEDNIVAKALKTQLTTFQEMEKENRKLLKDNEYLRYRKDLSSGMRFPTMWYVLPAKPQISLRLCTVWSEPLLVACIFFECLATDITTFGDSKLQRRLHRLVWVDTCQNATLLEITCRGSFVLGPKLLDFALTVFTQNRYCFLFDALRSQSTVF